MGSKTPLKFRILLLYLRFFCFTSAGCFASADWGVMGYFLGNSRIPSLQKSIKDRTANFIKFTKDDCAISFGYLLDTKAFESKLKEEINTYKIP